MSNLPSIQRLPISGLNLIQLDLRIDARGWFAETWQSIKFAELGLADFFPIQSNVSSNEEVGTTRGLHAEPWNKLVTITSGSAFAAWVDLREGTEFGKSFFLDLRPGMSVFIPAGVANGFQTTSPNTTYNYLVDGHWTSNSSYTMLNAFDPEIAIPWPITFQNSTISPKDAVLGSFSQVSAIVARPLVLLGSNGRLGRSLSKQFPEASRPSKNQLMSALERGTINDLVPRGGFVLNASVYKIRDQCSGEQEYSHAIKVNYHLVQRLSEAANLSLATLIHFADDHFLDNEGQNLDKKTRLPIPIDKYGVTRLLGELAGQKAKLYHVVRTRSDYDDEISEDQLFELRQIVMGLGPVWRDT
jgi:dTDP-4-dehydrorhamnose 3,5-epimerase